MEVVGGMGLVSKVVQSHVEGVVHRHVVVVVDNYNKSHGARNCDLRQRRQKLCTHILINRFSFTTSIQLTSKCTGSSK